MFELGVFRTVSEVVWDICYWKPYYPIINNKCFNKRLHTCCLTRISGRKPFSLQKLISSLNILENKRRKFILSFFSLPTKRIKINTIDGSLSVCLVPLRSLSDFACIKDEIISFLLSSLQLFLNCFLL